MKRVLNTSWVIFCTSVFTAWFSPGIVPAASPCDPWVAKMVSVQGLVEVRRAGQAQWQPARLKDTYCSGDTIQVGEKSRADVALANQPLIRLDQETTVTLGGIVHESTSLIELLKGALYFFSRHPRNLEVRTVFVNAGVEGTEGLVRVESDRTLISIFEGRVLAVAQGGRLEITGGQTAVAQQGKAPVVTLVARPRDAVQWAIYYVPTLYFRPSDFPAGPGWEGMVRKSIEAYMKGDLQAAFAAIKGVPANLNEPRFFAYRASLLLAVGRVDEGRRDIERALTLRPNYADALSLQAIIAVVQNDKEKGLEVAKQAVTADPKSVSALIALSYAQQANFDLNGALASLQQAVAVNPENTLAWARLAELRLSVSRLDKALEAAQKAVAIDSNLSRTQTMLGFAYLTQVNTAEAKKAFERAIALDQGDGLSRLGLGLAKIRDGDLIEGRMEIDIAVSLDPDNSLFRSYLGKAYFEEKQDKPASTQYQMAKDLDPKDPTPYFYDAIRKQTTNRPVEALQDMEKAIELNDNRAVYRSRLQLDSDLAARSAGLSRIYSDLGFQQLALVEGWKSVNTDPTNFSAHRFLADSYSILPRHEIARVSELLQSQLLQPLNMTPIQPRLAESNLFLISAAGPSALSFNEFNPLFNRNGVNFQMSGFGGNNSTYAGEGVLSGIYKKVAFSLGGFHFQTDGWRTNSHQRDSIGNALLQLELSPQSSIQAEFRHRDTARGDLELEFARDNFSPNLREKDVINSIRVGLRHALSPTSLFIGSYMYQIGDRRMRDLPAPVIMTDLNGDDRAHSAELQHLFLTKNAKVVSGVGHFNIDSKSKLVTANTIPLPFPPPPPVFTDDDVKHTNFYLYSNIEIPQNITLTLGGSGDIYDTDTAGISSQKQFNPKFGITWNPLPNTILRAAAFRTFKRTLITNQTLEPTQVAGFNQFFDDFNATRAWRYGIGIDQKLFNEAYGGIEYTYRTLEFPVAKINKDKNWEEKFLRLYLFWTPRDWLAVSAGYDWEQFDRNEVFAEGAKRVETHRFPLGVKLFYPSGLSASLNATYINQRGNFKQMVAGPSPVFESDKDDFWTVDFLMNYRLPGRYGFVTFGVTNLFDRKFKYFDTERGIKNINPRVIPVRSVFGRLTLVFP